MNTAEENPKQEEGMQKPTAPSISLPKGGGAIQGIGEKFAANPVTGTGSMTLPIATSPGRSGFGPQLSLSYDSGAGNGPFGFGWNLSLPAITRKTEKGLPLYRFGTRAPRTGSGEQRPGRSGVARSLRACHGTVFRRNELDVDALEGGNHVPVKLFTTAFHNGQIGRIQPVAQNAYAVYLATESEDGYL